MNRMRTVCGIVVLCLVAGLHARTAGAATLVYRSDADLIRSADRIVRAVVQDVRTEEEDGVIRTVATVAVLEDFSGASERVLEIRELGGVVNGRFLRVDGTAQYQVGDEIVVLLERSMRGYLRSMSLGLTKFDVVPGSDGDATLVRNLAGITVQGGTVDRTLRLSAFRQNAERIRGVRAVRHQRPAATFAAQAAPDTLVTGAEPYTLLQFGNGLPARWTEADGGVPIRWYRSVNAPAPLTTGSDGTPEIQVALSAWTSRPGSSLKLTYAGTTAQVPYGPWASLGGSGAGVIFFEDPNDEIAGSVLAIGGGGGTAANGGTVNGTTFNRLTYGFVIMQNAVSLPPNFREERDFTRVVQHEIGHAIGLGHSDSLSSIMYPSCCSGSTPVAPTLGQDDVAGLTFVYPANQACTYSVSPTAADVGGAGGSLSVGVSTQAGCSWSISNVPSWLLLTGSASRVGSDTVGLAATANQASATRVAQLSIASRLYTVTQRGCVVTVAPASVSISGRGATVAISVSAAPECSWSASSSVPWLTISPGSGGGNRTVAVTAGPNGGALRTGVIAIGTTTVDVSQPAVTTETDFNGDGRMDLLWHHRTNGNLAAWLMNGSELVSGTSLTPAQLPDVNWKLAGTGDLDGDGHFDLVWQNTADGRLAGWLMNGLTLRSGDLLSIPQVPDTGWRIASVGDADGDGRADLYWQHDTDGRIAVWLMNGLTVRSGTLVSPSQVADTDWKIAATADFNRDGHRDLLWHHRVDGRIAIWNMNGLQQVGGALTNPASVPDVSWQIRGAGDMNGDGNPDIIWQNTADGRLSVWLMRGLDLLDGRLLSPSVVPDTAWRIVGPR